MVTFAVLWFGYLNMLLLKVGISGVAISEPWVTSTQLLTYVWVKLLLLLESTLKLNFWGPLMDRKLEFFPRAHTHSDPSSINTQKQVKNYKWIYQGIDWTLYMLQVKTLSHWKARIWLLVVSKNNSRHTHQDPLKPRPVSGRSAYPLQNYSCFSPLTSGLQSFGHKSSPLTGPGFRLTVQNSS